MGRPKLSIGTHGEISYRNLGPRKVRALAWVRDADGRSRQVTAQGTSKADSRDRLQRRIADRTGMGTDITGDTRLAVVAAAWLAEVERKVADRQMAPNTGRVYRSALTNHVLPAVGELAVREATVARLNAFVVTLRAHNKASITKTSRTVLSAVMAYAVQHDAATTNPVREIARVAQDLDPRKARAMTSVERETWLARMEADEVASRHDLPDLTRIMLATGCRIGESLAIAFSDVDQGDKTIAVDHNIVRVTGQGLHRMTTKTPAGKRTLWLPGWAMDVVIRRGDAAGWSGPLFPNGRGKWRDPSNTSRSLREARDRAGFGWVTSHVFRKTVATVMDESGMTAREIADQLGHENISMTQNYYLGRKAVGYGVAAALEDMFDDTPAPDAADWKIPLE